MISHGVWKGKIGFVNGQSRLLHSFHRAPLKITKPFRGIQDEIIVYMMDSSPGLLNGDVQEIECRLETNAKLVLTTQSYCKLMPSTKNEKSKQIQRFFIDEGAVLEYFPDPLVPYKGAHYVGNTEIYLKSGGQAIVCDLLTPGRAGRGELFVYHSVSSQVSVFWNDKWSLWDSITFEPSKNSIQEMLGGYTHIGNIWILSERITDRQLLLLREFVQLQTNPAIYAGVSMLPYNGLVVRALGYSVKCLQDFIFGCWDMMRKELLNKPGFLFRK